MKRFLALLAFLLLPIGAAAQPAPTYQWITILPQTGTPSTAVNGTCWTQSTGLFCQYSGTVHGPFITAGGASLVIGSTPVTGGAAGRVLFDNGGLLGEYTQASLTAQIAAFTSLLSGAAPASGGGTANFLRADGTWAVPPGTAAGTITGVTAGTGLSGGGSSGTVTVNLSTPVAVANGGTGASLSGTGGASQVLKQVTTGAAVTVGQLACSDLSGVAASCSTDATNATNITSGTLPNGRLSAVPLTALATQAANTAVANVTSGSAAPTAAALPSCSDTGGNHLNYVSGSGFTCGTSTGAGGVQRLTTQIGPVGNGNDTSEDNLLSFTMSAGQLASNGQSVEIVAYGTFAIHSGTTRTAKCYFGATQIGILSTAGTAVVTNWQMKGWVHRSGAATQFSISTGTYGPTTANVTATESTGTTPAETLSGAVTIKCTGTTGAAQANDVVQNILQVNFYP